MKYKYYNCSGLTSVTIGNSVTRIGGHAFYDCNGLTEVYCYAKDIPEDYEAYGYKVFDGVPTNSATLYVPEESLEAYKATAPWSEFGTILALPDETGIESIQISKLENQIAPVYYDLQGKRLARPQRGINIVRMNDGTVKTVLVK